MIGRDMTIWNQSVNVHFQLPNEEHFRPYNHQSFLYSPELFNSYNNSKNYSMKIKKGPLQDQLIDENGERVAISIWQQDSSLSNS